MGPQDTHFRLRTAFFRFAGLALIEADGHPNRTTSGPVRGELLLADVRNNRLVAPLRYHAMVEFVNRAITGLVSVLVILQWSLAPSHP